MNIEEIQKNLETAYHEIASAPRNERVRLMHQIADRDGIPFGTVRNKYYLYQKTGDVQLIDRPQCCGRRA